MDNPPIPDLVTRLGPLMLGSRLKRLGEQMQAGVAAHLAQRGLTVQPAHLPLLLALAEQGPMTVGALGAYIGISQPGITRALSRLEDLALVAPAENPGDRRQRPMRLTAAGQEQIDALRADLFPAVTSAVRSLCDEAPGDLLHAIATVEQAMQARPLSARIADAVSSTPQQEDAPAS